VPCVPSNVVLRATRTALASPVATTVNPTKAGSLTILKAKLPRQALSGSLNIGRLVMIISPLRTGLALGGVVGLFHLLWAATVALGVAQPIVDFVFRIHFIEMPLKITLFDAGTAALLVLVTFAIGFFLGNWFAMIWNWLQQDRLARRPAPAR
jgi:hypothetical protein